MTAYHSFGSPRTECVAHWTAYDKIKDQLYFNRGEHVPAGRHRAEKKPS